MYYLKHLPGTLAGSPTSVPHPHVLCAPHYETIEYYPYINDGLRFYIDGLFQKKPDAINGAIDTHISGLALSSFTQQGDDCPNNHGYWLFNNTANTAVQYFKNIYDLNLSYGEATIECVYDTYKAGQWCLINQNATGGIMFGVNYAGTCFIDEDTTSRARFQRVATTGPQCVSINSERCVVNCEVITTKTGSTSFTASGGGTLIGAYKESSGNWPFYGKLYAIRIYDRLLTIDEMKYNQLIDIKRFKLFEPVPSISIKSYDLNADQTFDTYYDGSINMFEISLQDSVDSGVGFDLTINLNNCQYHDYPDFYVVNNSDNLIDVSHSNLNTYPGYIRIMSNFIQEIGHYGATIKCKDLSIYISCAI